MDDTDSHRCARAARRIAFQDLKVRRGQRGAAVMHFIDRLWIVAVFTIMGTG
jgi:hypothetical protein